METISNSVEGLQPIETSILNELLSPESARSVGDVIYSEPAREFAFDHQLDVLTKDLIIGKMGGKLVKQAYLYVGKETYSPSFTLSAIDSLDISLDVRAQAVTLFTKIVAETPRPVIALSLLDEEKAKRPLPKGNKGKHLVDIDVMQGLLYGFKPCDIAYYVKTRRLNAKQHRYDKPTMSYDLGRVVCEECAKSFLNKK